MSEKVQVGKKRIGKKAKIVILIAVVLLSLFVATVIVQTCYFFFAPRSTPKYIAHMGYNYAYTGNTEKAFKAAAEMDFYAIETDIRKSSTGDYVCHHDPLVKIKPEEETHFCTFVEYLEICKSKDKMAIIELKEDFPIEDVKAILALIDQHYNRKKVSVISFFYSVLLRVKDEDATIPLQYLSEKKNDPNFDKCLNEKISIDVSHKILTKKLVQTFHKAGLTVNVWNVNKPYDQTMARIRGVDYITSDRLCNNAYVRE